MELQDAFFGYLCVPASSEPTQAAQLWPSLTPSGTVPLQQGTPRKSQLGVLLQDLETGHNHHRPTNPMS